MILQAIKQQNSAQIQIYNEMELTSLSPVFDKIRTLCKQCDISPLPSKLTPSEIEAETVASYLNGLDELRSKIFIMRSLEEQYKKLEQCLQKHQTEVRKHIGKLEQQLKLYIDALKMQFQDSESERLSLLQNSKKMIKQLKKDNEKLFQELQQKKKQFKTDKSKRKLKKDDLNHDSLFKNRVHTIGELQDNLNIKKKIGHGVPYKIQLSERQNRKKREEKLLSDIRKKQNQNFTMLSYVGSNQKKPERDREKTPGKKRLVRDQEHRINFTSNLKSESKYKKKAYNSVFSLSSLEEGREERNIHQKSFTPFQN